MIGSFEISNYRKFEQVKLSNLARINIFLGGNNVGKTTVLEAFYGFACGDRVVPLIHNSAFRSGGVSENVYEYTGRLRSLFHCHDEVSSTFSFSATFYDDSNRNFKHVFYPNHMIDDFTQHRNGDSIGRWEVDNIHSDKQRVDIYCPSQAQSTASLGSARFVDFLDHRDQLKNEEIYSLLYRRKQLEELASSLAGAFPFIREIVATPYPDESVGKVSLRTNEGELVPLYNCGEGLQRLYHILGGMIAYPNAIHCIEGVDATMHPQTKKQLARSLVELTDKYNNQLFITSQSLEFVDRLLDSIYDDGREPIKDDVRVITMLHRQQDILRTRVLTGQDAYRCREDFRIELR